MFTGIIRHSGTVRALKKNRRSCVLTLESAAVASKVKTGGSVSVNGVCLTAVNRSAKRISFQLVAETLKRSALGSLRIGERVNLELPLKLSDRLDGHFVLGHVDGKGEVKSIAVKGKGRDFLITYPNSLAKYLPPKGSITVDGVSLTLGKVTPKAFRVHIIPHTLKSTNFRHYHPKTKVNLEADILAKLAHKR